MILRLYNCDNRVLDTDEIAVLEIESPKIFSKIMCDFLYREFPAREIAVERDGEILQSSDICCISDYFNLDFTGKAIIGKLYKQFEKELFSDFADYNEIMNSFNELKEKINRFTFRTDIITEPKESPELKEILNFVGIIPLKEQEKILENLIQYVNICAELKLFKVMVFVNLKFYLNETELETLYRQSLYKGLPVILLEGMHREKKLQYEKKLFLDKDFCDTII